MVVIEWIVGAGLLLLSVVIAARTFRKRHKFL